MIIEMGTQEPEHTMTIDECERQSDGFCNALTGLILEYGVSIDATVKFHNHNGDVWKIMEVNG